MYFPWAGEGGGGREGAVISPFAVTAGTSPTVLKPLYSLAIPEVNSSRFAIHFLVDDAFQEAQSGPCDCESARRDAVKSRFFSE